MGIELRLPNITGATEREQLAQVRSYLYQLTEQLQWALNNVEVANAQVEKPTPTSLLPGTMINSASAQATFASIKALIIKSADIVDSYYEKINRKLEGAYVAQSDFGAFVERTSQQIEETSTSTTQRFENLQIIITDHDSSLSNIEGSLVSIGEDLSYAQKDILTLGTNIYTLDQNVASVEGGLVFLERTLDATKSELSGNISYVNEELKSAKTEISGRVSGVAEDLKGAKTELSESINSTKEELTGNITNVKSDLEESIDSTKGELTSSIDSAKSELSDSIESTKNELTEDIDTAKTELSEDIDSAKSELTDMVGEVDEDLQTTKTDVNGRIDDTNGSVASLGEGLNDANTKIADVDEDLQDSKASINESIQGVQDSVTGVNALLEDAKAQLQGSLDDLDAYVTELQQAIIGVTAYLKSGLLYYTDVGIPVYGLEIGQSVRDEVAGTEVFNKYARFTSEKLSFYDSNGIEVAYISDKKLFIRMAEITVSFQIGGFIDLVMPSGDVVTKWVGG